MPPRPWAMFPSNLTESRVALSPTRICNLITQCNNLLVDSTLPVLKCLEAISTSNCRLVKDKNTQSDNTNTLLSANLKDCSMSSLAVELFKLSNNSFNLTSPDLSPFKKQDYKDKQDVYTD